MYVLLPDNGTASHAIDSFPEFGRHNLRTRSDRPVHVQLARVRADDLQKFVESVRPADIIVCDSPEQLASLRSLQSESAKAVNVCGNAANCPAVIAPWVEAQKREAVEQVFRELTRQ